MGKIIIQDFTTKNPISMIGMEAGVCYGSDTKDKNKNFKRGLDCLKKNHGRTFEFPDVYMILDGYSARVIREWYTHIGGSPTRLQESTRYVNYQDGFDYVIPDSIKRKDEALQIYNKIMNNIEDGIYQLEKMGIPREDSALGLPLGMKTKIVCKHNFRNLMDMSRNRMCSRAYWEYQEIFYDLIKALKKYSEEWDILTDYFYPKCASCNENCPNKKEEN